LISSILLPPDLESRQSKFSLDGPKKNQFKASDFPVEWGRDEACHAIGHTGETRRLLVGQSVVKGSPAAVFA
jgi:hypothetical protein